MACYTGDGTGVWLAVSDGFSTTSTWCALTFSLATNAWVASMHDGIPGWFAAFVVVY